MIFPLSFVVNLLTMGALGRTRTAPDRIGAGGRNRPAQYKVNVTVRIHLKPAWSCAAFSLLDIPDFKQLESIMAVVWSPVQGVQLCQPQPTFQWLPPCLPPDPPCIRDVNIYVRQC
jgi:hypothetical protein